MEYLQGNPVILDLNLLVFFRSPRSNRRRIIKKWKKRTENWKPDPCIYWVGSAWVCHPTTYHELKRKLPIINQISSIGESR